MSEVTFEELQELWEPWTKSHQCIRCGCLNLNGEVYTRKDVSTKLIKQQSTCKHNWSTSSLFSEMIYILRMQGDYTI